MEDSFEVGGSCGVEGCGQRIFGRNEAAFFKLAKFCVRMNALNPVKSFGDLWRHRGIILQFSKRYVQMGFRGSALGALWIVLGPLLMLGLYSFVFGSVFKGSFSITTDAGILHAKGVDFALGIFLGLIVLNLFSGVLGAGSGLIVSNPNFVKKVVFPLEILPVALVGQLLFNFAMSLVLCLIGLGLLGPGVSVSWLWAPLVILPVILMGIGLAWMFSAIGVFLRDVGQLAPFLGSVLLYASAVFYPVSLIQEKEPIFWMILKWNPALHCVDQLRRVLLWGLEPNWNRLFFVWVAGIVMFQLGAWVFHRLREDFADLL